jgi:hypothetical protein
MSSFRRFVAGLVGFLLFFSLMATPVIFGLYRSLSPEVIKGALKESGIYDSLLRQSIVPSGMLPAEVLADAGVQKALSDAAPPSYMQATTEKIIDSAYGYVRGETQTFDFSVDLTEVKAKFADNMAAYAAGKYAALPPCSSLSSPPVTPEALLEATCASRLVPSSQVQANVREQILTGSLLPSGDILDEQALYRAEGTSLFGPLEMLRAAYPYLAALIYAVPALDAVLVISLIFLSATKRQGLKRVASLLLSTGITNGVLSGGLLWLSNFVLEDRANATEIAIVVWSLAKEASGIWLWISLGFVLLAIIIFVILKLVKDKKPINSPVGFTASASNAVPASLDKTNP